MSYVFGPTNKAPNSTFGQNDMNSTTGDNWAMETADQPLTQCQHLDTNPNGCPGKVVALVKKYLVNAGFDMKFDRDAFPTALQNRLPYQEFLDLVDMLNLAVSKHRTKKADIIGLFALSIFYMGPFMHRKKKRSKKRKIETSQILLNFNNEHQHLRARINRKTGDLEFQEWILQ